jgi:hypothetical protein
MPRLYGIVMVQANMNARTVLVITRERIRYEVYVRRNVNNNSYEDPLLVGLIIWSKVLELLRSFDCASVFDDLHVSQRVPYLKEYRIVDPDVGLVATR